jgi:AcrR family transcriptional regulator
MTIRCLSDRNLYEVEVRPIWILDDVHRRELFQPGDEHVLELVDATRKERAELRKIGFDLAAMSRAPASKPSPARASRQERPVRRGPRRSPTGFEPVPGEGLPSLLTTESHSIITESNSMTRRRTTPHGAVTAPRRRVARRRDPEDKRERILRAARSLFVQRGYAATRTADLARRAGVSEGIVFHHFGSKAAVLAAVAGDYGRGLAEAMFEAAPAPGEPPSAEAMLRRAFDYVRNHGPLSSLLAVSGDPADSSTARRASRSQIVAALARGYEEWSRAGFVRAMSSEIVAELTYALVEAALRECFVSGRGAREEEYLREAVLCIEGAIRPPISPASLPGSMSALAERAGG